MDVKASGRVHHTWLTFDVKASRRVHHTWTALSLAKLSMPVNWTALPHLTESGNHGSPSGCFVHLNAWFETALRNTTGMSVLDVGGGLGEKTDLLRSNFAGRNHTVECIDVVPSAVCKTFDGWRIPLANRSQDIIFFSYSLHHASDATLALLSEAARVARRTATSRIAVLEDLKADSVLMQRAEAVHQGCTPTTPCTFRGDREWRLMFDLLQLDVVEHKTPSRHCARPILRALYILQLRAPPPSPCSAPAGAASGDESAAAVDAHGTGGSATPRSAMVRVGRGRGLGRRVADAVNEPWATFGAVERRARDGLKMLRGQGQARWPDPRRHVIQ